LSLGIAALADAVQSPWAACTLPHIAERYLSDAIAGLTGAGTNSVIRISLGAYHHIANKEALFTVVLETLETEVTMQVVAAQQKTIRWMH
jgi:hypothetical protein